MLYTFRHTYKINVMPVSMLCLSDSMVGINLILNEMEIMKE